MEYQLSRLRKNFILIIWIRGWDGYIRNLEIFHFHRHPKGMEITLTCKIQPHLFYPDKKTSERSWHVAKNFTPSLSKKQGGSDRLARSRHANFSRSLWTETFTTRTNSAHDWKSLDWENLHERRLKWPGINLTATTMPTNKRRNTYYPSHDLVNIKFHITSLRAFAVVSRSSYSFAYARAVNISWYCRLTFAARDWF